LKQKRIATKETHTKERIQKKNTSTYSTSVGHELVGPHSVAVTN